MDNIKNITLEQLKSIRDQVIKENQKLGKELREEVRICMGGGCIASGSTAIKEKFEAELVKRNITDVKIRETGCLGPCSKGPVMVMVKDRTFYQDLKPEDVEEIVSSHIENGKVVERLVKTVAPQ